MTLQIISPEGILFQRETSSVTLPGAEGSFSVLHNHAPLLSVLAEGTVTYDDIPGGYAIRRGIVEVKDNIITVYI